MDNRGKAIQSGPRYCRVLNDNIENYLLPNGQLHFLIDNKFMDDKYALDIHIREKNKLIYYHGTTKLLTVDLCILLKKKNSSSNPCNAAKTYQRNKDYKTLMNEMKNWKPNNSPVRLESTFKEYLRSAIKKADKRYYSNKKEGYWQNRICVYFSRYWTPDKEWLIIDRESVIGHASEEKKKSFYKDIKGVYNNIKLELQKENEKRWGEVSKKGFGDELDMLAIGPNKELLCIELKHRSNTSGIYWGPLQASIYRDAFDNAKEYISEGIKEIIQQKIKIGLLPSEANCRIPSGKFTEVKAILAIAGTKITPVSKACKENLEIVQEHLRKKGKEKVPLALIHEENDNICINSAVSGEGI